MNRRTIRRSSKFGWIISAEIVEKVRSRGHLDAREYLRKFEVRGPKSGKQLTKFEARPPIVNNYNELGIRPGEYGTPKGGSVSTPPHVISLQESDDALNYPSVALARIK